MMMFPIPNDLVLEIFTFDGTYKEIYGGIIKEAFDGEYVRALKTFLTRNLHFPTTALFDGWLSMQSLSYRNEPYYEVAYPDAKLLCKIISIDDKAKLDDLSDPTSPRILANMLHTLPDNLLLAFLENRCTPHKFMRIKQGVKDKDMFNKIIMTMLPPKDYEDLVYHLQVHGTYEEAVHGYMFRDVLHDKFGADYDDDQSVEYDYVAHESKMYMVMWYQM